MSRVAVCVIGAMLCGPALAHAGMPSFTAVLNEVPKLRIQAISFFLVVFLLSALLVQWLWNSLRKDYKSLPELSYLRAVGLVTLWGLLFVLVLTMISGARELMTPGAWEPNGITHRLAHKAGPAAPDDEMDSARREQLERLKEALWRYAKAHDGRFPPSRSDPAIPPEMWRLPGPSQAQYVYAGGAATLFDPVPLAHEPEVFGRGRWVLFTDGAIRRLSGEELQRAMSGGKP